MSEFRVQSSVSGREIIENIMPVYECLSIWKLGTLSGNRDKIFYDAFDQVWIFALQTRGEHQKVRRAVGKNVSVIPVWYASRCTYLINAVRAVFDPNFYQEFLRLVKSRRFNKTNVINLFVFFSRAHYEAGIIRKKMKNQKPEGDVVFYSYRFEYQPYVAVILRKTGTWTAGLLPGHTDMICMRKNTAAHTSRCEKASSTKLTSFIPVRTTVRLI